ncbi:hypothetical protein [Falsiroseomonas tokyonensis]|uniref:Uncharacterized protein n=1 Tax=Falsiroseomonas tokyonensis TaxID=430521 RepID=A0ABV7BYG5_9PROT|nr:hypothetical protein [Falsiroseomonas tokyonensis]MBU8540035.1 hypothetical protein [Falsiroseomonas tokyonensis]
MRFAAGARHVRGKPADISLEGTNVIFSKASTVPTKQRRANRNAIAPT